MKAVLDHVGIAVKDLNASLAFFRDALGLEVDGVGRGAIAAGPRAVLATGPASLELLQATSPDSPIARFIEKRGPGLHHITLRVEDIRAALTQLRRARRPARRRRAEARRGRCAVAFIHPSSAHGVLVELKQVRPQAPPPPAAEDDSARRHRDHDRCRTGSSASTAARCSASCRRSSGRKRRRPTSGTAFAWRCALHLRARREDDAHRRRLRRQDDAEAGGHLRLRARLQPAALAGRRPASRRMPSTSCSRRICISITPAGLRRAAPTASVRPRFPRAQYIVRRGEWEDAMHPNERTQGQLLSRELQAAAPITACCSSSTRTRRSCPACACGAPAATRCTIRWCSSSRRGKTAVFAADLLPTAAHLPEVWIMGYDLYPARHAQLQASFPARSHRARVSHPVRARSGHRGRIHPREATGSGT